jgi:hypothetical protein
MENNNIDDLLKSGFSVNPGDALEVLLLEMISSKFLMSETLRRVIAIEHRLRDGIVNDERVSQELDSIADQIAAAATIQKNSTIADLHLRNK